MAKFTRTAYAGGSLRDIAREIAHQAQIAEGDSLVAAYDELGTRRTSFLKKRVRITILVEAEPLLKAPKHGKGPKRPRPIQGLLPLSEISRVIPIDTTHPAYLKHFGADGGSTP